MRWLDCPVLFVYIAITFDIPSKKNLNYGQCFGTCFFSVVSRVKSVYFLINDVHFKHKSGKYTIKIKNAKQTYAKRKSNFVINMYVED